MPQGTVKRYDHDSGTAVLLDDQLVQLEVGRDVVAAAGVLELRLGQRVKFELAEDGDGGQRVTNLSIVSM